MKNWPLSVLWTLLFPILSQAQSPESWIDRLIAVHAPIQTLRCEIRRERTLEGKTTTRLSRVWYARGGRLRVESVTPLPTRVLADGTTIYKWLDGDPDGVRLPVSTAPENEKKQLRQVPGTAEEYLLRLEGAVEEELPPTPDFPRRIGCRLPDPQPYGILSINRSNLLSRIEFFDSPTQTNRLLLAVFSNWKEVLPNVHIPCLHQIRIEATNGGVIEETVRISRIQVNLPMSDEEFSVSHQAPSIHFISPEMMEQKLKGRKK